MSFEKAQKDASLQRKVSTQTRSSLVSQDYGMLSMQGSGHLQNNGYGTQVASSMGMGATLPVIQPKLTIGQPNDKYEQEADHVAKSVVSKINHPSNDSTSSTENISAISGNTPVSQKIMKMAAPEEISEAETDIEGKIESSRGSGRALPDSVKAPMENAFGSDFSNVRIHTDNNSDKLNKTIQAKAFTTGSDIYFKSGEFKPQSKEGQELVAHELTHVRQQAGTSTKGGPQSAVQRSINTLSGSSGIIQRFGDSPGDSDTTEVWLNYFKLALEEIKNYNTSKDCSSIGSSNCIEAKRKLGFLKSCLLQKRFNEIKKGKSIEDVKELETWAGLLMPEVVEAMKIKDSDLEKLKKAKPLTDTSGRDFNAELVPLGWDLFSKILEELSLNSGLVKNNIITLMTEAGDVGKLDKFLKLLFLTTKECYEEGLVKLLVDKNSFINHLKKLENDCTKSGYSGALSELQVLASLLKDNKIMPGEPAVLGKMKQRTVPYSGAMEKQDIDLKYKDSSGEKHYIEVKDRVTTLESKMNDLIGNVDHNNFGEQDSKQLSSLVQIVNDKAVKGKKASLTIACISPYGWVRFITTDHCVKLIIYKVSLKIGNTLYTSEDLALLRQYVENVLTKEFDPEWKEKSMDEKLPIITPTPVGNRHESAWTFEEKQPHPPTPEEIKKGKM
ncbi:MAG: DUF4157 domain-containing protein [Sporocytophaga sp.]|nr:DUF4157 domain-containing protein [Sporocytophaga sp.]